MSKDQERQKLVKQMLRATTEEEVEAATKAAKEWLKKYPDDLKVLLAGEQLAMMEDGLKFIKSTEKSKSA